MYQACFSNSKQGNNEQSGIANKPKTWIPQKHEYMFSEPKNVFYMMPSEGLDNLYDVPHNPLSTPPVAHWLHPSLSMESLGGEGMPLSTTLEMASSFEDMDM